MACTRAPPASVSSVRVSETEITATRIAEPNHAVALCSKIPKPSF
jgi:hypothetical protein